MDPKITIVQTYMIVIFTLYVTGHIMEDSSNRKEEEEEADNFLTSFGYYSKRNNSFPSVHDEEKKSGRISLFDHDRLSGTERKKALRRFQSFYHIEQSGKLDTETIRLMKRPRCGNVDILEDDKMMLQQLGTDNGAMQSKMGEKDTKREQENIHPDAKRRVKRYKISTYQDGSVNRWQTDTLTWKITKPTRQMGVSEQSEIIRKAIAIWAKVVPIRFIEESGSKTPDIEILFASGKHGSGNDPSFDGATTAFTKSNKLAHAFGPGHDPTTLAGDVHFDEGDKWNSSTMLGVAVHELGHSMGLGHSKDENAIMYPFYRNVFELGEDDIRGIQALYGTSSRRPTRPMTRRPDGRFQTVRPDPRGARTPRPTPRYWTRRPQPRYRTTQQPDPRYRTDRPDPRYRTHRPDPRYRTRRPDPRYLTRRPDPRYQTTSLPDSRYWLTRPDSRYLTRNPGSGFSTQTPISTADNVDPTAISNALCSAALRKVNAVFKDPSTKFTPMYFAIAGKQVHRLTSSGDIMQTLALQSLFPKAPNHANVIFSLPEQNSVFFIKENRIWQYKDHILETGYPKPLQHFPEAPKFLINGDSNNRDEVHFFGSTQWWTYDVLNPTQPRFRPLSDFSPDFPNRVKFAARWTDGLVYAVSDNEYTIIDTRGGQTILTKPVAGHPDWLKGLCNNGNGFSTIPSLMLVIVMSFISRHLRS